MWCRINDSPTNQVIHSVVIVCRECSDRLYGAWGLGKKMSWWIYISDDSDETPAINISYNNRRVFDRAITGGITSLYGLTGWDSILILEKAISVTPVWEIGDRNYIARRALRELLAMAEKHHGGIWSGSP